MSQVYEMECVFYGTDTIIGSQNGHDYAFTFEEFAGKKVGLMTFNLILPAIGHLELLRNHFILSP